MENNSIIGLIPWPVAAAAAVWFGVMAHKAGKNRVLWAMGGGILGLAVTTIVIGLGQATFIPFYSGEVAMFRLKIAGLAVLLVAGIGWLFTGSLHRHAAAPATPVAAPTPEPVVKSVAACPEAVAPGLAPLKISVIIPAFNEERLIGETLLQVTAALSSFSRRGWETETIVCDNNSTDRTAELARAGGAMVVFEPVNQIARARNCGAAAASGDWLVFIDADSRPSAELFAEVAEQIEGGRCLAGGCTMRLEGNYLVGKLISRLWNSISRIGRLLAGSFIFCEAAAFWQVGGFNNELFAAEELDLSQRLKRLARERQRRIVVLHRHPLLTSARKLHLYTPREHFRFLIKVVLSPRKVLANRDACPTWYDGRR